MQVSYVDLAVRAKVASANNPQVMKRHDDLLTRVAPACFHSPQGTPIQNSDGTFDVRVLDPQHTRYVRNILETHCNLEIVKETPYE